MLGGGSMGLLCFEDFAPGSVHEYGAYAVTAEEIMAFARDYDPQYFHLDPEAAKASLLGGLCASGWHTAGMLMRMNCDGFLHRSASMGGPGIESIEWKKPVFPGDVLSVRSTCRGARRSRSRPGMGLVDFAFEVLNQRRETVMVQVNTIMMGARDVDGTQQSVGSAPDPASQPSKGPAPQDLATQTVTSNFCAFLEDIVLDVRQPLGSVTFTKDAIIRFASAYDPQPFHLDEEAAAQSHFGALAASGWHTAAAWMGQMIAHRDAAQAACRVAGKAVPAPAPSPGFSKLRWIRPVHAGDTISYDTTPIAARPTSRPGWGLVQSLNSGTNQNGVRVFEFVSSVFWQGRG